MKAVVCTRYGPPEVLQLRELEEPAPKDDEVRIKIHATAVTSSDCIVRSFSIPAAMWIPGRLVLGITKPRSPVLGMVLAGEIESVGKDVGSFIERDQVFGFDRFGFGAYAEYKCMPESGVLTSKPSNLSYEEAAAIPYGGMLALHFLRRARSAAGKERSSMEPPGLWGPHRSSLPGTLGQTSPGFAARRTWARLRPSLPAPPLAAWATPPP